MHKWKVGQRVFVVKSDFSKTTECYYERITKVGRKWITFNEGWKQERFNAQTMRIDGGKYSSPGQIYLSEEEYKLEHEVKFYLREIKAKMYYTPQGGVTVSDILAAANLLKLELKEFT